MVVPIHVTTPDGGRRSWHCRVGRKAIIIWWHHHHLHCQLVCGCCCCGSLCCSSWTSSFSRSVCCCKVCCTHRGLISAGGGCTTSSGWCAFLGFFWCFFQFTFFGCLGACLAAGVLQTFAKELLLLLLPAFTVFLSFDLGRKARKAGLCRSSGRGDNKFVDSCTSSKKQQ